MKAEAMVGRKKKKSDRKSGDTCDDGLQWWQRAAVLVTCKERESERREE